MSVDEELGARLRRKLDSQAAPVRLDEIAGGSDTKVRPPRPSRLPLLVGAAAVVAVAVSGVVLLQPDGDTDVETTDDPSPTAPTTTPSTIGAPSTTLLTPSPQLEFSLAADDVLNDLVIWNDVIAIATSVTGTVDGRLYLYDPDDGSQLARHDLPGEAIALASGETTLWVATMDAFDVTGTALFTLAEGGEPTLVGGLTGAATLHAPPGGETVWVSTEAGTWAYAPRANQPVVANPSSAGFAFGWMTSHEGQLIRTARHAGSILTVDWETGEANELLAFTGQIDGPTRVISHDGEVVVALDESLVFTTGAASQLTETGRLDLGYRATVLESGPDGILVGSNRQLNLVTDGQVTDSAEPELDGIHGATFLTDATVLACEANRCETVDLS